MFFFFFVVVLAHSLRPFSPSGPIRFHFVRFVGSFQRRRRDGPFRAIRLDGSPVRPTEGLGGHGRRQRPWRQGFDGQEVSVSSRSRFFSTVPVGSYCCCLHGKPGGAIQVSLSIQYLRPSISHSSKPLDAINSGSHRWLFLNVYLYAHSQRYAHVQPRQEVVTGGYGDAYTQRRVPLPLSLPCKSYHLISGL